jgi:dTDP-4-dehydrorhamnose 3,5-epimerase
VALDLRADSHIFRQHLGLELSAAEGSAIYLPPGVAHGFLTLEDDCEVHYAMSAPYAESAGRGVRYDDPAFGIVWPEPVRVLSARDRSWPDFVV